MAFPGLRYLKWWDSGCIPKEKNEEIRSFYLLICYFDKNFPAFLEFNEHMIFTLQIVKQIMC